MKLKIFLIWYNYYLFIYIYILFVLFYFSNESNCTQEFPFFNKIYNECKDHCLSGDLINNLCVPTAEFISTIEETKNILEDSLNTSKINPEYEYIIKGENVIFQITNTELLKNYNNKNNAYSNSYINIGECENHLKKDKNIPNYKPLIIMLINIINTSYITTFDEGFLVYDPINKNRLNILDTCNSKNDAYILIFLL